MAKKHAQKQRENTKAQHKSQKQKVTEKPSRKETSEQAAKNMSYILNVNEQNTWASFHTILAGIQVENIR